MEYHMTEDEIGKFSYLIVDDDDFSHEVLTGVLASLGAKQINSAMDGESALRLARQLRPDFILLDIYMPNIDGWAVLDQLRSALPQVVVVMVTGSVLPADFNKSMNQRVDGYCIKPVLPEILRKTLVNASSRRQAARR
jgi:CheY-like chemotaxis protein